MRTWRDATPPTPHTPPTALATNTFRRVDRRSAGFVAARRVDAFLCIKHESTCVRAGSTILDCQRTVRAPTSIPPPPTPPPPPHHHLPALLPPPPHPHPTTCPHPTPPPPPPPVVGRWQCMGLLLRRTRTRSRGVTCAGTNSSLVVAIPSAPLALVVVVPLMYVYGA